MKKSCERLSNASRVLGRFFAMCALKYCHHAWYERMHSSCERGDLESVLKLLRRDGRYRRLHFTQVIKELNRSLECGEVFLHAAVRSKSLPLVSALISHGASVSKRDFNGETPVFLSIREGDESLSITKYLIEMYQGKDYHKYLEIRNQLGETPCDVAMLLNGEDSKHIQTVTFLWERGAATTPETEACMFLLQESSKRNKIIKERREVLNERIRVAENQADVGWKMIRLDESTRGTIFENLVHNNNYKKNDRACSIFFFCSIRARTSIQIYLPLLVLPRLFSHSHSNTSCIAFEY